MVSGAAADTGGAAARAGLHARVVGRYRACSRYTRGYVTWKLRLDPVHRDHQRRLVGDVVIGHVTACDGH